MIKEAIQYLRDTAKKQVVEVNKRNYNSELIPITEPTIETIHTQTLTSLSDYILSNPDEIELDNVFIHVNSHNRASIISSSFGSFKQRELYLVSSFEAPSINYGSYMDLEKFLVMLNSNFQITDDLVNLVDIISNVVDKSEKSVVDNGLQQNVTIKKGLEFPKEVKLPRLVQLKPYRTFPEIDQPVSDFYIRIQKIGEENHYALFEADGGRWKNDTILLIKDWLVENIAKPITVIS